LNINLYYIKLRVYDTQKTIMKNSDTIINALPIGFPKVLSLQVTMYLHGNLITWTQEQIIKYLHENADYTSVSFKDVNLQNMKFQGINLVNINFEGANLQGANLSKINLQGANFEGANLQCANFYRTIMRSANLQGANLEGANLERTYLENTNFEGANLYKANMQGAFMQGANLKCVNLKGVDLYRVNLKDTIVDEEINTIIHKNEEIMRLFLYNVTLENKIRLQKFKRYNR
jgi:uncharacterized protein YjbI with pentapeptide repeats